MANFVLTDAAIFVHGYDLGVHSNQVNLSLESETVDNTTFGGGGYRSRRGGLKTTSAELQGFHDADPSTSGFSDLGVIDRVLTVAPARTEGSVSYLARVGNFSYSTLGQVGEMNPFTINAESTNAEGAIRGALTKFGSVSATGVTGTAVNLGAGGAGKFLYLGLHVLTAGTTLSVQVQSATTQGGTYSFVGGASVTLMSAVGGYWMTRVDASAFTSTWYKINVTAITGTFNIAASLAIQ